MRNIFYRTIVSVLGIALMLGFALPVLAQTAAPMRLRATVEKIADGSMTIKERSGEEFTLVLDAKLVVTEVYAIDISDIKPGNFIGSAALPRPDGTLEAIEVLVFPESMRGAGEGHRAWDLMPESTMTNATVDAMTTSAVGRTLKLKYKDGEKTLNVPLKAPIVTFKPADQTLLVPGARVIVTAELRDGKPTALRITAGRNGFMPPM